MATTDGPSRGTDADLLKRLQGGDNGAWTSVTRDYAPRLYNYLRQNLPTADDAEDALSETMAAAVRAIANFDGRAALSTFLYAIAFRKVADFWRRTPHTMSLDGGGERDSAQYTIEDPDVGQRLEFEEALNSLPELSRQVLLLRYQVGLGVDEIAEVVSRSYKGTESLLSRARTQLRDAIEGQKRRDAASH